MDDEPEFYPEIAVEQLSGGNAATAEKDSGAVQNNLKGVSPRSKLSHTLRQRRGLRNLIRGDTQPPAPMRLIDRLIGSPYANPRIRADNVEQQTVRRTMNLALDLGESLLRYGSGAMEVETSIIAVLSAFGLKDIDVYITYQSLLLNYANKDQLPITLLRVVRDDNSNYNGLSLLHQLVSDIVDDKVALPEAIDRLQQIIERPKPFPPWIVTLAQGIFAAALTFSMGGSGLGVVAAFVSNLLVSSLKKLWQKKYVPEFFITVASAYLISSIALILVWCGVPIRLGAVIAGGLLMLLPVSRLISAIQDAINGFQVTAAGRFLSGALTFGALIAGTSFAIVVSALVGVYAGDIISTGFVDYPVWVRALGIFIGVVMIAVVEQTAYKMLIPTGLIGTIGFMIFCLAQLDPFRFGQGVASALASIVIGFLGRVVALRLGAPQLVIVVPAVISLMPGLMIFRAIYRFSIIDPGGSTGLVELFSALVTVTVTAAGVVLGNHLARPIRRAIHTDSVPDFTG